MDLHKYDMCGLYLDIDGTACEECIKVMKNRHKETNNHIDSEYKEDAENEYYI